MSPFTLSVLLHYYASPEPYYNNHCNAYSESINTLKKEGLLESRVDEDDQTIFEATTAKGDAYVSMLLSLPRPEEQKVWVHPLTGEKL